MATGIHTYAGSTPASPTAIQNHFLGQIAMPAARDYAALSQFSKKELITGSSYNVPSYKKIEVPTTADVTRAEDPTNFRLSRVELDGKSGSLALFGEAMELDEAFRKRNMGVIDIMKIMEDELRQSMGLRLEILHKAALDTGNLVMTPTGSASQQVDVNGTASQAAAVNLSVYHYQYLSLLAGDTYAIPGIRSLGGNYAYFSRGEAFFALQRDPEYQARHEGVPSSLSNFLVAQVGKVKLFHTPEEQLFANNLGTNSDVAEGVLLGEDCLRMYMNSPFQVFIDQQKSAANTFGTKEYLWYKGDLGVITPTDSVEKRRIRHIRVTSA